MRNSLIIINTVKKMYFSSILKKYFLIQFFDFGWISKNHQTSTQDKSVITVAVCIGIVSRNTPTMLINMLDGLMIFCFKNFKQDATNAG